MLGGGAVNRAAVTGGTAVDAPAGSIAEAVEQLMRDREVEEAVAEWARGEQPRRH